MFAPLPLAVIELLATDLKPHDFAPGTAAVREGEAGDLFYLIVAGSATVKVGGKARVVARRRRLLRGNRVAP
jgi:CRP-like cAMP-binding protein